MTPRTTLTSDDLESHIVVNVSSTSTNTTIWFVAALCLIVDVQTDGRTHGRTFLPGLLGHLSGDDLKMDKFAPHLYFCNAVSFMGDKVSLTPSPGVPCTSLGALPRPHTYEPPLF